MQNAMYALGDAFVCLPDVFFVTPLRVSTSQRDYMHLPLDRVKDGRVYLFYAGPRGGADKPPMFADPDLDTVKAERRRLIEALDAWHNQFLPVRKTRGGGEPSKGGDGP